MLVKRLRISFKCSCCD